MVDKSQLRRCRHCGKRIMPGEKIKPAGYQRGEPRVAHVGCIRMDGGTPSGPSQSPEARRLRKRRRQEKRWQSLNGPVHIIRRDDAPMPSDPPSIDLPPLTDVG